MELLFGAIVVVLVFILAYTAFGKRGQRNISEHPVDTRTDVPPGAGNATGIANTADPAEANNPNAQRGVK